MNFALEKSFIIFKQTSRLHGCVVLVSVLLVEVNVQDFNTFNQARVVAS